MSADIVARLETLLARVVSRRSAPRTAVAEAAPVPTSPAAQADKPRSVPPPLPRSTPPVEPPPVAEVAPPAIIEPPAEPESGEYGAAVFEDADVELPASDITEAEAGLEPVAPPPAASREPLDTIDTSPVLAVPHTDAPPAPVAAAVEPPRIELVRSDPPPAPPTASEPAEERPPSVEPPVAEIIPAGAPPVKVTGPLVLDAPRAPGAARPAVAAESPAVAAKRQEVLAAFGAAMPATSDLTDEDPDHVETRAFRITPPAAAFPTGAEPVLAPAPVPAARIERVEPPTRTTVLYAPELPTATVSAVVHPPAAVSAPSFRALLERSLALRPRG